MATAGLRAGDLPASWDSDPADSGDVEDDVSQQADLRGCAGMPNNAAEAIDRAESSDFYSDPFDVWSLTTRYRTSADNDIRALLARPKFVRCFELLAKRGYTGQAPIGSVVGKVTATLTRGPGGGAPNVVGSITARTPVTDHGDRYSFYDTVVFLTGRGVETEIYFSGQGRPVPAALQSRLGKLLAARTAAA